MRLPVCAVIELPTSSPTAVLRANFPCGPDALQENAGGLIGGVLRDQLATERLAEDGMVEMVNELAGVFGLGGELVVLSEGGFDLAHRL